MIVPVSATTACQPPTPTVPFNVPVAPAKVPDPPMTTSTMLMVPGGLNAWLLQAPGHEKFVTVSCRMMDPCARSISLMLQVSPHTPMFTSSVAWPNGSTSPLPQLKLSPMSGHTELPGVPDFSGSANFILTATGVAAVACDAKTSEIASSPATRRTRRISTPCSDAGLITEAGRGRVFLCGTPEVNPMGRLSHQASGLGRRPCRDRPNSLSRTVRSGQLALALRVSAKHTAGVDAAGMANRHLTCIDCGVVSDGDARGWIGRR